MIAGGALVKKGVISVVNSNDSNIFALTINGRRLFNGFFSGNLMVVKLNRFKVSTPIPSYTNCDKLATNTSIQLLHELLGHVNKQYLRSMIVNRSVEGLDVISPGSLNDCITCIKSKLQRLPFKDTRPRSTDLLQNVHVDLSSIVRSGCVDSSLYYILFTDDYSSYRFVYNLPSKNK